MEGWEVEVRVVLDLIEHLSGLVARVVVLHVMAKSGYLANVYCQREGCYFQTEVPHRNCSSVHGLKALSWRCLFPK